MKYTIIQGSNHSPRSVTAPRQNHMSDLPTKLSAITIWYNFLPQDTPSLAEALQSGYYHIKWTTCSDLPTLMYSAYVAVSNEIIYCTGTTPNEDNRDEVYSYNAKTDKWTQFPRAGHRLGVLHMVDDKLTIFGGRDSTTN